MVALFGKILKLLPVAGVALIAAAVALSMRRGQMDEAPLALILLGFGLFLAMFLKIEAASLRYYLNLLALAGLMLGIVTLIYLLILNHSRQWDVTKSARYSLSKQTLEILRSLKKPVHVEVWATQNEPYHSYLGLYREASDRLSFRISNPYKKLPAENPEDELKGGDIWIESEGRKTRIEFRAEGDLWSLERDLVNGILTVIREERPRLYLVEGHGEKSPVGTDSDKSIRTFADKLSERALEVRAGLDLLGDALVPDDCAMLAIIGPQTDYDEKEIGAIRSYLDRGGSSLVMLDPPLSEGNRLPRLRALLAGYGIDVSERFAADYGSYVKESGPLAPLVRQFSPLHPITERLGGSIGDMPVYLASPIAPTANPPKGVSILPLIFTSERSWTVDLAEFREARRTGKTTAPPSAEWQGLSLGVALSPTLGAQRLAGRQWPRIVVLGDSDFLSNAQLGSVQAMLGYLAVTWLIGQSDLIAIPPRMVDETTMALSPRQRNLLSIISVVVIPFVTFFAGLAYTTMRRRTR